MNRTVFMDRNVRRTGCWLSLALLAVVATVGRAQFAIPTQDQLQGFKGGDQGERSPVSVKAVFTAPAADKPARLYITAEIEPGWHTYSITMGKGGPITSKIKLPESKEYRLLEEFTAAPPPEIHLYPEFAGVIVEEHKGRVTWHAPIELAAGVDPAKLKIAGQFYHQVCNEVCLPPKDLPFTATLGPAPQLPGGEPTKPRAKPQEPAKPQAQARQGTGVYKHAASHATIRGVLQPKVVAPGETLQLTLRAEPDQQWHIYPLAGVADQASKPTIIVLTQTNGWTASKPHTDSLPVERPSEVTGEPNQVYHEEPVTWTVEIQVPRDAQAGTYTLAGMIGYQTCWPANCDLPRAARFEAAIEVAAASTPGEVPLYFEDGSYNEAAKLAKGEALPAAAASRSATSNTAAPLAGGLSLEEIQRNLTASADKDKSSLVVWMFFGFLGGLILNLMPCVLPVIGLKVLSFVEQSGHARRRVLLLNIWYSLGMIAVFLVLATLAVVAGLGWGEQFGNDAFNITLAAIVFAMGLSFLGVWEIPIPGFVGGEKANELAAKEGVAGAFSKGVITTVLATPCTGPFLGSSLAWALRQPPHVTYLLFTCVGLGMASPYLLIGAFPRLVRFLPKPGAWMDTFKQMMGFVLLGTVVFLMTFIDAKFIVPTVALMFGIWAGCWWIGRTPGYAEAGVRLRAWLGGTTFAMLIGLISFNLLAGPSKAVLPWKPYTLETLAELADQKKTVMVDFTANWCLVCKTLKSTVLDTEPVRKTVDSNKVVPLLADWTDTDPEIKKMLTALGSESLPVLAIFPAGRPNHPIVFREPYTRSMLIKALEEAGPSLDVFSMPVANPSTPAPNTSQPPIASTRS
jgi:thiol:disulfide interchange protein